VKYVNKKKSYYHYCEGQCTRRNTNVDKQPSAFLSVNQMKFHTPKLT